VRARAREIYIEINSIIKIERETVDLGGVLGCVEEYVGG
jgi:hypothetical protein